MLDSIMNNYCTSGLQILCALFHPSLCSSSAHLCSRRSGRLLRYLNAQPRRARPAIRRHRVQRPEPRKRLFPFWRRPPVRVPKAGTGPVKMRLRMQGCRLRQPPQQLLPQRVRKNLRRRQRAPSRPLPTARQTTGSTAAVPRKLPGGKRMPALRRQKRLRHNNAPRLEEGLLRKPTPSRSLRKSPRTNLLHRVGPAYPHPLKPGNRSRALQRRGRTG